MKVLLLYTSHRQVEELEIAQGIYNKNDFLKQMDVLLHCNNPSIDKKKIAGIIDGFDAPGKKVIFSEQNSGHHSGVAEAIHSIYEQLKEYDFVIHTHPDVFLVHTKKLEETLHAYATEDVDYIVWDIPRTVAWEATIRENEYTSDFFIFRPKEENNIFRHYYEYWEKNPSSGCERFLHYAIHKDHLKVGRLDRDPYAAMIPKSSPEPFGIWHCHHLPHLKEYMRDV